MYYKRAIDSATGMIDNTLRVFYVFLFSFSLIPNIILAQFADMKFEYLTVDNGLSNNRIRCIMRDSKDFLWIGTEMGLNKYDGLNFTVYENIESDENSISGNDVLCILEDSKRNLWFGTNKGLNLFNRKTESFSTLIKGRINSIIEGKQNTIWVTTNDGIYKLIENKKIALPIKLPSVYTGLKESKFLVSDIDKYGNLWLVDNSNVLWKFNPQNSSFTAFTDSRFPKTDLEKCIKIDNYGIVWIGTKEAGLFSFDSKLQKFNKYNVNANGTGISGKSVYSLTLDGNEHLLITVNQSGLNRLNVKNKTFEYFLSKGAVAGGLNNENLKCVYKDKEGITWIGTGTAGINIHNPRKNRFLSYHHTGENSLSDNNVFRFFEDSQGLIWIGTDGGGVSLFDPKTKIFKNFRHNPADPYSIGGNSALCITEDRNHDIWIGCWAGGLNKYDRKSGRFFHFLSNPEDATSISSNDVWAIQTDSDGHLWLSYYEIGLDVFDINKGVIKKYRNNPSDTSSLPSNVVLGINHLKNNKIGFITENGYCIYNPETKVFQRNKKLDGVSLFDVYEDKKGNLWVATKGSGLWIIWANGKIEKFNKSNGFPSNVACGILEDNQGNIWISTYSGLSEYVIQNKNFRHYSLEDGLQGAQFTPFAKLKAFDGTLYFGGYNGFNSFNPESIKPNSFIPPVFINEFQIFNKSVTLNTPNTPLTNVISETKELVLSYKQSVFSFGFAANNYTYPKKALYAYKMNGYDKAWIYTDINRRYATYTNLNPGKYTFMVKATNNDGIWNEKQVFIDITITPPWWGTWWFRIIVILLISSIIVSIYRIRINGLKKTKKELEIKVSIRTEELIKSNLKLEEHSTKLETFNSVLEEKQKQILSQNEEMLQQKNVLERWKEENIIITKQLNEANQVKNRFFTNISHEFRTPLSLILAPLDSIISYPELNHSIIDKLKIIKENGTRLLRLVNQLLELRNIDSENIPLQLAEQDIIQFLKSIYNSFLIEAESKHITYNFISSHHKLIGLIDSEKLEKIVSNLLSNAFKFTQNAAEISIHAEVEDITKDESNKVRNLMITVADSGIGIEQTDLPHIFDRFFQSDSSLTRKHEGSGIGLALCKELVEIYSGSISVESEPEKGSRFVVTIPVELREEILYGKKDRKNGYTLKHDKKTEENVAAVRKSTLSMRTLLIVEDNYDMRRYLRTELENEFNIIEAKNGQNGIEKAKEFLPDIVLSDVMMPIMDGFRFCELLKTDWQTSHIPIVLLTAKTDAESLYTGLEIGADAYIAKPFDMLQLRIQIKNLVNNREKLIKKYSAVKITNTIHAKDSPEKELINKVMQIIDENIANQLFGVDLLADKLNMSRSVLYKKVMEITNVSIGEIIRKTRLEKAALLLQENRHSIMEIALSVGFTDHPQFTRSFTNNFGIGPKQYQQENK